jgi:hypothetical protein
MSDGTSIDQIPSSEQAPPVVDEPAMAPDSPPPLVDPAAPPSIGDPMNPPAVEPAAIAEHGGAMGRVAKPLPPFEPILPTIEPPRTAHLDHSLPDERSPHHTLVECPNCGSQWEGDNLRPHAAWFCGTCDFPLFWAGAGAPAGQTLTDAAFARLPGTDGRDAMLSLACPTCGEQNPPVPTANCLRCGSPLTPPPPVIAPAPAPAPIIILPPEPPPQRRIWPWVVATCVLATALLIAIVVALNRS